MISFIRNLSNRGKFIFFRINTNTYAFDLFLQDL